MRLYREALIFTIYYCMSLAVALLGSSIITPLDKESEDFLYLAEIVKTATIGKASQGEQIKALTEWLATNVKHSSAYPGWFDGSSVASVIRGGIGNCGYQANNIITLSKYLGVRNYSRYWVSKQTGCNYDHTFAEMTVDGKVGVFDPDLLLYQQGEKGEILSLREMVREPSVVENAIFREIVSEIKENPSILRKSIILIEAPMPMGNDSYNIYLRHGSVLTQLYLHSKCHPLLVLVIAWVLFLVSISIRSLVYK